MIHKVDVHEVACLFHPCCEPYVLKAWLGVARRMVVKEDYPVGIVEKHSCM